MDTIIYYIMPFKKGHVSRKSYSRAISSYTGASKPLIKKAVAKEKKAMFTKAVKKVMLKTEEVKEVDINKSATFLYNYNFDANGAGFSASLYQISPVNTASGNAIMGLAQGTTQSTRIGNKIRIKKAILRICLYPAPYDAGTNAIPVPQDIVMYIFKVKNVSTYANGQNQLINTGTFFQNGNSSSPFNGTLDDINELVNKDVIILHKRKVFKIGIATGSTAGVALNYANNDYKFNRIVSLDVTSCLHKVYDFNDASDSLQLATFLIFETINADGSAWIAGNKSAKVSFGMHIMYTDV